MRSNAFIPFVLLFALLPAFGAQAPESQAQQKSQERVMWKHRVPASTLHGTPEAAGSGQPMVSSSPQQLTFGSQAVGTVSGSQTVTLTNTGAGNLSITNVTQTGDFRQFNTCIFVTILPNGTCSFTVFFAPAAVGTRNGNISIAYNAADSPQNIPLVGTGDPPMLSTSFLAFDKQVVGTTSPAQPIVVLNNGAVTINISSIVASPGFGETNNCGTSLLPGAQCTIQVTFSPSQVCGGFGTLTINDDAPGAPQVVGLSGLGSGAGGLSLQDLSALTPTDLVNRILGTGVVISNVKYTGVNVAAGAFTSGTGIFSFDGGIILSTGSVHNVVGPNCSDGISRDNGQPGDPDLNALIPQGQTFDAAVLEFDFIPVNNTLSFEYVFSSDEYNEFVNSPFNDVFGFFVNGTNVALIPGTTLAVSINNVNGGNPLGMNVNNPQFYLNNEFFFPASSPFNTEMDGLTVTLTVQTPVLAGQTNHIKLAIADASDPFLDSNVFIKAGSLASSTLTFSPATLAFGDQTVGRTSAAQIVTVKNNGSTSVTIQSIVASANFGESTTCPFSPATFGPGATCTISVTFTPGMPGFLTGNVTITGSAPDSPESFNVSGTGTIPVAMLSAINLPFGNQALGTTAQQTVTLTSAGTGPLTISSISITSGTDFSQTNNCPIAPQMLSVNSPCQFQVTFAPKSLGPQSAHITIADDASDSPQTIAMTGTGVPGAKVSLSATSVTFASQPVNSTSTTSTPPQPVTLTNSGTGPLTVSSVNPSGDFADTTNCDTASPITPNGTCTINISFTPTTTGTRTGTITIVDSAPGSPHVIQLSGAGTDFTISTGPGGGTTATVHPGDTAVFLLTLSGSAGFNGPVTLGCKSQQSTISCSINPTTVTLSSTGTTGTSITVNTFCSWVGPGRKRPRNPPWNGMRPLPQVWLAGLLGLIMLGAALALRRRRWNLALPMALFIFLVAMGCASTPHGPNGQTPPGTYNLTISATAQGATRTINLTITVL